MNRFNNTQKKIIIIVIIIVIGIIGYYIYGREKGGANIVENEEILVKKEEKQDNENKKIMVHVTGAVKNEGVVTLSENSRIADAVETAGGLTEDADMSKINLAYVLEDGMKLRIPSKNDVEEEAEEFTEDEYLVENIPQSNTKSEKGIVNINKATQTELETLPGIGPSIALKIINYREENGKFTSIEDLKNVNGIGDSKFDNIKEFISVK